MDRIEAGFESPEAPLDPTALARIPADIDEDLLPAVTPQELALLERRELVGRATVALREVLELPIPVSVGALLLVAGSTEQSRVRLRARRALRCLAHLGTEESAIAELIGDGDLYPYVEAVMDYGASTATYLGLAETLGLAPDEVTRLYVLREGIAEYTNGEYIGFPTLCRALEAVRLSPRQAAADTDAALTALDEAGYFVNVSAWGKVYDNPIFKEGRQREVRVRAPLHALDHRGPDDSVAWLRRHLSDDSAVIDARYDDEV